MSDIFPELFIKDEPNANENNIINDVPIERDEQSLQFLAGLTTYLRQRNGTELNKCPYCRRTYRRIGDLKRHYALEHCPNSNARVTSPNTVVASNARAVNTTYPTETRIPLRNNTNHTEINHSLEKSQQPPEHSKLKHYDMYLFWDQIIADLPKECLNQVRFQVTALLCEIQKQHKDGRKESLY